MRFTSSRRPLALGVACLVACGCGGAGHVAGTPAGLLDDAATPTIAERGEKGLRAPDGLALPSSVGAHLFPDTSAKAQTHGVEANGGTRLLVDGLRVLSFPDGSIAAAPDRFPGDPTSVVPVPDRLGGGFLYALDRRVWRSEAWLAKATPVVAAPWDVDRVLVGLDRVYLHAPQGALAAVVPPSDGSTRWVLTRDLGPFPGGPHSGRLASTDAWHGVALADLQGALTTSNAGASWQRLDLPFAPAEVKVAGGVILVGGPDEEKRTEWWEVRADGQAAKVSPPELVERRTTRARYDAKAHPLGDRPLRAALEDGVPLVDGTALVLRDGTMARVRLSDGKLVEVVADAFPLDPARCHPLSLAAKDDPAAFGFVCGEPRGRTIVYRWEPALGRPVELRRFASPREVLAFGNGAVAVHGPCTDASSTAQGPADTESYCVLPPRGTWRAVSFRGDDAERARLVVLGDGRVVVLRPPVGGDLSTGRLAFVDDARASEVTLSMPPLGAALSRVLREGIWRDGFEERRPGVLGGWVDDADSVLGVEVSLDGAVRVGEDLEDAVVPIVSGRWGLAWTASRRGFETTDGGMSWRGDIQLPDPLVTAPDEATCGPLGCISSGWLRVGWGPSEDLGVDEPAPAWRSPARVPPSIALDCQALTPLPPGAEASSELLDPFARHGWGPFYTRPVPASAVLPALGARKGPKLPAGTQGISAEARLAMQRTQRGEQFARIYAWGPSSGDWDPGARWQVAWQWPWGAWLDVRASAEAVAPWSGVEAARQAIGLGVPLEWSLTVGDADHALLWGRRVYGPARNELLVLEANRPPLEVRRPGGEPMGDLQGAVRMAGHWYVATPQAAGELPALVLWIVEGARAREIARLPRLPFEPRAPVRLASRDDGRTLGVVVDGEPSTDAAALALWALPVDVNTGAVGAPEPLGAANLGDRSSISLCTGDDSGWLLDLPYPGEVEVHLGPFTAHLQAPFARMRLAPGAACLERVLGSIEPWSARPPEALVAEAGRASAHAGSRTVDVSVLSARTRYVLRCARP